MIGRIKALFNRPPDIRFVPHVGAPHVSRITRIQLASEVVPKWLAEQRHYDDSRHKFHNCPGMVDLMRAGYIVSAWDDIRIKANRAGTVAVMERAYTQPLAPMNHKVVAGIALVDPAMPLQACKLNTPWSVTTRPGVSAMVLPAPYHSPFLGDLHVYGGINDYEEFHTLNLIFTPLRECEVFIPAGTPLLQIIPFVRAPMSGATGAADPADLDRHNYAFPTRIRGAYRKFFHHRKKFTLEHQ